jgi:glycosyltransferase involved in cell wall biosynthesis
MMDQKPLFSVVIATARENAAFLNRPDWRVLDKIVECCDRQTFRDFELIVVDVLHEFRPRYFEGVKLGFPVLHIPDKRGPFKDAKLTRICSARNTGIMYARGQFLVTGDDGEDWSPDAFQRFVGWVKRCMGATGRLYRDNGAGPESVDSRFAAYRMPDTGGYRLVLAASAGYLGGTLTMTPMSVMLRCNGFDEMFDGSRQLEDADLAYRLGAARLRVALDGSIKVVEYAQKKWEGDSRVFRATPHIKCNGAYFYPIMHRRRIAANDRQLTSAEVETFLKGRCPKLDPRGFCSISKGACLDGWKWGTPEDGMELLRKVYLDQRLVFSLKEQQEHRSWETAQSDPLLF